MDLWMQIEISSLISKNLEEHLSTLATRGNPSNLNAFNQLI
jgi:hypothetical protein